MPRVEKGWRVALALPMFAGFVAVPAAASACQDDSYGIPASAVDPRG